MRRSIACRREAPPEAELTGIKKNLAGVFVVSNASRGGVISQLVFVDQHRLGDDYLRSYVTDVMSVTAEQVRRVAEQYLAPSDDDARRRRRHEDGQIPGRAMGTAATAQ